MSFGSVGCCLSPAGSVRIPIHSDIHHSRMKVDIKHMNKICGVDAPWTIFRIISRESEKEVEVHVECAEEESLPCPTCGQSCPVYDRRPRRWRHLDMIKYRAYVVADVPRVSCPEHGVLTVSVPWASRSARVTHAFEVQVIDWLQETTISAVSRRLGMSWTAVDGIMQRAVDRGLARREQKVVKHIGVDETSYKKRHNYITVVIDAKTGKVLYVGEGRTKEALGAWYESLCPEQLEGIESVSMDMWPAFIKTTEEYLPEAKEKIAFDKFHVVKYIADGVDTVRKQEHRALRKEGRDDLTGTKYDWLTNEENMSEKQKARFEGLRQSTLKTAEAWAFKEAAKYLWQHSDRTHARKDWESWLAWVTRSQLEPMKKAAKTIREHLWGIINAILLRVTNGPSESMNSRIKTIKVRARGFRNHERLKTAIYFYLGGLNLYP